MISIERLPEPLILTENKEKWLTAYLKKRANISTARLPAHQYGHQEIRNTLRAMSRGKCSYCEYKLAEREDEVDHYIEVREKPELAFDWGNLYLSCQGCNRKKVGEIPVSDCLDPCDLSEDPAKHLTFDDEYIRPRNASPKGARTIQKYRLDRDELDYLRGKQLRRFHQNLDVLRKRQIQDGGRAPIQQEKEAIYSFEKPHHAFSLMFKVYLSNLDL